MYVIGRKEMVLNEIDAIYIHVGSLCNEDTLIEGINVNFLDSAFDFSKTLQIKNVYQDDEKVMKNNFLFLRYYKIYNDMNQLNGLLIDVKLTEEIACGSSFDTYEITEIMRDSMKTCANMVHIDADALLYRHLNITDYF